jgi:hypothetical protein
VLAALALERLVLQSRGGEIVANAGTRRLAGLWCRVETTNRGTYGPPPRLPDGQGQEAMIRENAPDLLRAFPQQIH